MDQLGEYTIAWLVYVVAALGLLLVCWRLFRGVYWRYLRRVLWLTCAVVLLTPAVSSENYWAPAWVIGSLEALFGGLDTASPIVVLMVTVLGVVLGIYTVFCIISVMLGHSAGSNKYQPYAKPADGRRKTPPRVT